MCVDCQVYRISRCIENSGCIEHSVVYRAFKCKNIQLYGTFMCADCQVYRISRCIEHSGSMEHSGA